MNPRVCQSDRTWSGGIRTCELCKVLDTRFERGKLVSILSLANRILIITVHNYYSVYPVVVFLICSMPHLVHG